MVGDWAQTTNPFGKKMGAKKVSSPGDRNFFCHTSFLPNSARVSKRADAEGAASSLSERQTLRTGMPEGPRREPKQRSGKQGILCVLNGSLRCKRNGGILRRLHRRDGRGRRGRSAGAWARHHLAPIILPLWHQPTQGQDHGSKMIKGTSSRCFGRTRIGGSRERAAWVRRVGGVAAGLLS